MKKALLLLATLMVSCLSSDEDPKKILGEEPDTYDPNYNPDIGAMVFVKGGTFTMGCTDGECGKHETPTHQVTLTDYYIGKYEVTQKEWFEVMGINNSFFIGDELPVEMVSWYDIVGTYGQSEVINGIRYYANGFIYQLNQKTGKKFRLPTEAEWEYAARGGAQSRGYKYSGSNNIDEVAWHWENSYKHTHPVGLKKPNELGIYDMSGNVWELCSDWWGEYTATSQTNPAGPTKGKYRVDRGGAFSYEEEYQRVAYRGYDSGYPTARDTYMGLRLACTDY